MASCNSARAADVSLRKRVISSDMVALSAFVYSIRVDKSKTSLFVVISFLFCIFDYVFCVLSFRAWFCQVLYHSIWVLT